MYRQEWVYFSSVDSDILIFWNCLLLCWRNPSQNDRGSRNNLTVIPPSHIFCLKSIWIIFNRPLLYLYCGIAAGLSLLSPLVLAASIDAIHPPQLSGIIPLLWLRWVLSCFLNAWSVALYEEKQVDHRERGWWNRREK